MKRDKFNAIQEYLKSHAMSSTDKIYFYEGLLLGLVE